MKKEGSFALIQVDGPVSDEADKYDWVLQLKDQFARRNYLRNFQALTYEGKP